MAGIGDHLRTIEIALETLSAGDPDAEAQNAEAIAFVRALREDPANVQALALARLIRDRSAGSHLTLYQQAFDLPRGYWLVRFEGAPPFECGIAPDGSVSS